MRHDLRSDSHADQRSPVSAGHDHHTHAGQSLVMQQGQADAAISQAMQCLPGSQGGYGSPTSSPSKNAAQALQSIRQHSHSFLDLLHADQHSPPPHTELQTASLQQLPRKAANSARRHHTEASCYPRLSINTCNLETMPLIAAASTEAQAISTAALTVQHLDLSRCVFRGIPVNSQSSGADQDPATVPQARQPQPQSEATCQPASAALHSDRPVIQGSAHELYHLLTRKLAWQQHSNSPSSVTQAAFPTEGMPAYAQACTGRMSTPAIPPAVPRPAQASPLSQALQQALRPPFAPSPASRPKEQQPEQQQVDQQQADQPSRDEMVIQQEAVAQVHGACMVQHLSGVPVTLLHPQPTGPAPASNSQPALQIANPEARHGEIMPTLPVLSGRAVTDANPPETLWPASAETEVEHSPSNEELAQTALTASHQNVHPASAGLPTQLSMQDPAEPALEVQQHTARQVLHSGGSCSLREAMPAAARRTSSQAAPLVMIPVSSGAINDASAEALDQISLHCSPSPEAQAWDASNAIPADAEPDQGRPSNAEASSAATGMPQLEPAQSELAAIVTCARHVLAGLDQDAAPGPATPVSPIDSLNDFDFDVTVEQFQALCQDNFVTSDTDSHSNQRVASVPAGRVDQAHSVQSSMLINQQCGGTPAAASPACNLQPGPSALWRAEGTASSETKVSSAEALLSQQPRAQTGQMAWVDTDSQSMPAWLTELHKPADVLQVAAMLCGKAQFTLNDLHAVCAHWSQGACSGQAWPGLHAVANFSSSNIGLAKQTIFQTLQQSKRFLSEGHASDGLQQWSLRCKHKRKVAHDSDDLIETAADAHNVSQSAASHQQSSLLKVRGQPDKQQARQHVNPRQTGGGLPTCSRLQSRPSFPSFQAQRRASSNSSRQEQQELPSGGLPASVHAKLLNVMHKVLGSPTASHPNQPPCNVRLPHAQGSLQSASAQHQDGVGISQMLLSHQQASSIRATAEAVLRGIDWATAQADDIHCSVTPLRLNSADSSSPTCRAQKSESAPTVSTDPSISMDECDAETSSEDMLSNSEGAGPAEPPLGFAVYRQRLPSAKQQKGHCPVMAY